MYDWAAHGSTGYAWWIQRFRALLEHVDLIRFDHFRAFAAAWHVPAGARTAEKGRVGTWAWAEFFEAVSKELGGLPFVAEDLGEITADVCALRDQFNLRGPKLSSLRSMATVRTPTCPRIIRPTMSSILRLTITPPPANGTRSCPSGSGSCFGST